MSGWARSGSSRFDAAKTGRRYAISIANCAETVYRRPFRHSELDLNRAVSTEHYPGRLHPRGGVRDESFDLVTFGERRWNHLADPNWRRLDPDQVSRLIGQQWVPEHYPAREGR